MTRLINPLAALFIISNTLTFSALASNWEQEPVEFDGLNCRSLTLGLLLATIFKLNEDQLTKIKQIREKSSNIEHREYKIFIYLSRETRIKSLEEHQQLELARILSQKSLADADLENVSRTYARQVAMQTSASYYNVPFGEKAEEIEKIRQKKSPEIRLRIIGILKSDAYLSKFNLPEREYEQLALNLMNSNNLDLTPADIVKDSLNDYEQRKQSIRLESRLLGDDTLIETIQRLRRDSESASAAGDLFTLLRRNEYLKTTNLSEHDIYDLTSWLRRDDQSSNTLKKSFSEWRLYYD